MQFPSTGSSILSSLVAGGDAQVAPTNADPLALAELACDTSSTCAGSMLSSSSSSMGSKLTRVCEQLAKLKALKSPPQVVAPSEPETLGVSPKPALEEPDVKDHDMLKSDKSEGNRVEIVKAVLLSARNSNGGRPTSLTNGTNSPVEENANAHVLPPHVPRCCAINFLQIRVTVLEGRQHYGLILYRVGVLAAHPTLALR